MRTTTRPFAFSAVLCALCVSAVTSPAQEPPKWFTVWQTAKPMDAAETRAFIKRLATFAVDHHMKKTEGSPQRGMMYEYWEPAKKGQLDQYVQGEALDTMHDGAWFALAMVSAYRATGDDYYKSILTDWQLPFYCKMLNHSDTLFNSKTNHARPERQKLWGESKEWLLQDGEKGFVPYWWDDGGSVSLERVQNKNPLPDFPAFDAFAAAGQPNPKFFLSGHSYGSSNHLAQDLAVMLEGAWLLLRDDPKWAKELADAARNLQQCRKNHGSGSIPAVVAAAGMLNNDAKLLRGGTDGADARFYTPNNHYTRALVPPKPGQRMSSPGFTDDQQYLYYSAIARAGGQLPKPLAFKLIYDAYTQPKLYDYYFDDAPRPPGVGGFDLHPFAWVDGKPVDYRSDKKGPHKQPRPLGSRFGPQNMAVSGLALQALKAWHNVWDHPRETFKHEGWPDDVGFAGGFATRPDGMFCCIDVERSPYTFSLFAQPGGKGPHAVVTVDGNAGTASAVNDRGEPLTLDVQRIGKFDGKRFPVRLTVPFTARKGQGTWGNVVEHSTFSVKVGDVTRDYYYSTFPTQVPEALERELGLGLRTWQAVFDELGYVPTGMGEPRWQRFSDTGGYAHLIQAAAQWLMYLEGKRDWETHDIPKM